jgi:hypothetical protein
MQTYLQASNIRLIVHKILACSAPSLATLYLRITIYQSCIKTHKKTNSAKGVTLV